MATFTSTVYQNEFLPDGGTDVNAIVRLGVSGAGRAGASGKAPGEIIIVDTSGSMGQVNMAAAKNAAMTAVDTIADGTFFAVVAGTHEAYLAYPMVRTGRGMVEMNPRTRAEAKQAISWFNAEGGTAIGAWLNLARALFGSMGDALGNKHALLLTDGEDRDESQADLDMAIRASMGVFQCDCRGVGTDWIVSEIRKVSSALLGTVDIIPDPSRMAAEFASIMQASASRGVTDAELRVWVPQGAQVLFVRQVSPTVDDLTARGVPVNPLTSGYPTGSWSDEERDYHVGVRLPAKALGQEQLAARVQLVVDGQPVTQGLVKATWSNDAALTTRISPEVAHYTGQTELAAAIQEGLAAKASGDEAGATTKLGRAIQLAVASGNEEATSKLKKVVDVVDAGTGTVRLKRAVDKADEMALDTASTKTTRIKG
ncbi:vWA domain-containing protein [Propioniciclava tarda]|uniref:VWA domain-containing protein n=1 Tax=Propioniciclava tarda TaxID=433330 RepID=A0A4Q9KQY1_PROTD|nr:VWA domain-containing protein [Propioniciclava tarda]TBT96339.1 VWA domain-containing protein [Propioniciclava tarda]SMO35931.1 Secreted protein containing Ig-like domain and vWFA domain [Propioniciclava tarda]